MAQRITCPNPECGRALKVPEGAAGRDLPCPACGATVAVPLPPTVAAEAPGLTQIGRYQIRERLGGGAFGVVYRACDPHLDRDVAVKVPLPGKLDAPGMVARFQREARTAARLYHPHIVPVFDAGHDGAHHFIVSALIHGRPLDRHIPAGGLDPRRAVRLALQLVEALAHAHGQGVTHRDVKPANLLADDRDQLHLTDFGLAAWTAVDATRLTVEGAILGTPAYMAPELVRGAGPVLDPRSDQYSAGVVLYQLLTGRLPFEAAYPAILHQIATEIPPPPTAHRPGLDPNLEAIVLRAMAHALEDRFPDCRALAAALTTWRDGAASVLVPTGGLEDLAGQVQQVRARAAEAHARARELADRHQDYAAAVRALEALPADLRHAGLFQALAERRDRVAALEQQIRQAVAVGRFAEVRAALAALRLLQPGRPDLDRLAASLPPEPVPPPKQLTNSIGLKLTWIPAGTFLMGSPEDEADRMPDEGPRRRVTLTTPFYLGVYPVTQREYEAVMGRNPAFFTAANGGGPDHPVEQVSWEDAVEFCRRLSALPAEQQAGRTYRLPTEAEWEYACRAGTTTAFAFGPRLSSQQANCDGTQPYGGASKGPNLKRTSPVGSYAPNGWGLYDLHGNVWEWCQDYYHATFYRDGPAHDPVNLAPAEYRIVRGGSWLQEAVYCRSAMRYCNAPDVHKLDYGFRIACTVPLPGV